MRIILHVDMDSFYASVEEREHPEYKGKPIVVGADPKGGKGRGVVSTCSYAARKFGIHSAMPISKAYKLCPQAIFLPVSMSKYVETSGRIMSILRTFSDTLEQVSVDEAYLDITSKITEFSEAKQIALDIKENLLKKENLTCSIGISSNKLAAKIASDYQKPSGLVIIPEERIKDFFSPLPVRRLPGVGEKTERELNEMGINTIGDLAAYDLQKLISRFGKLGIHLHQSAEGIDESEVNEEYSIKSINRNSTFEQDTFDLSAMNEEISQMAQDIKKALDSENLSYKTVGIRIRYFDFQTHTREKTLPRPETSLAKITETAVKLLSEHLDKTKKVRQIGVRITNLCERDKSQFTLGQFS